MLRVSETGIEIMRCIKRYNAREIFHALQPPERPAELIA
jgi:hypothetical protein